MAMEQQQYEPPIHFDRHGAPLNLNLVLAIGVAVVGYFIEPTIVVIGLAFAAFAWFTTPSIYSIYPDHLVIAYGRPRVRKVFFHNIDQVQPIMLPFGSRLIVSLRRGGRLMMQPRDVEGFSTQFHTALESFRSVHGGGSSNSDTENVADVEPESPDPQN